LRQVTQQDDDDDDDDNDNTNNVKIINIFIGEIILHVAQIVNTQQLQHCAP